LTGTGVDFVDLQGEKDQLVKVVEALNGVYEIERVAYYKNANPRIDLKGNKLPYLEVLARIAKQCKCGLQVDENVATFTKRDTNEWFTFANPPIGNYAVTGPYVISLARDSASGQISLVLVFSNQDVSSVADVEIEGVELSAGAMKRLVAGRIRKRTNPIEWVSDGPVRITKGMRIQGFVKSPNLTGRYVVEGLSRESKVTGCDLNIHVSTSAVEREAIFPMEMRFGRLPETINGHWMRITIQAENNLTADENAFVQNIRRKHAAQQSLTEVERRKYDAIRESVPTVYVPLIWQLRTDAACAACTENVHQSLDDMLYLCDRRRLLQYQEVYGIETNIFFDSEQGGEDVFPVGMLLRKYEIERTAFVIRVN